MPEDFAKIATSEIYWRVIAVIDKFSDGKKGELLGLMKTLCDVTFFFLQVVLRTGSKLEQLPI